jgi:multimeric flavodoxin WrbA
MNFKRLPRLENLVEEGTLVDLIKTQKRLRRILPQVLVLAMLTASLTVLTRPAMAQQEGMFIPTGSMNNPRGGPTATLLNNGKVLVTGPTSNGSSLELYDPATGTFTPTANVNTAGGYGSTATLLNNGTVLVTGVLNNSNGTRATTAGLYDPVTSTVTPTGSMTTTRLYAFTATLLNNGKVLVTGGVGGNSAPYDILASAELYDPATGLFTATGSMSAAREYCTATLLNNGKVLVAGGYNDQNTDFYDPDSLAGAELYDPATGLFTATGSMNNPRGGHTATLLSNGKVLVAGGSDSNSLPLASAELYDPAAGTFAATGSMNTNRVNQSATLLNNGTVLVAGGLSGLVGNPVAGAELYDPATGLFTTTGSMNAAREYCTATLLNNGTVLVAGGEGGNNFASLASSELYIPVGIFPTSLSFPDPPAGTTSESETVTLTNSASTALSIPSIAISGTNASDFAETDNCLGSVAAGASCSLFVTFTPAVTGSRAGILAIANNLTGAPLTVPLSGTGIAATRIALSANSLSFTSQPVGVVASQALTFSNAGNAPLIISQLAISGSSDFTEYDNCGGSISAGATCTINVGFVPSVSGTRTGTLIVTDNATSPQSPQTIALSGIGTDFSLGGIGTTTAAVTAGQTATYNLQLSPMGGFTGSVTLACSSSSQLLTLQLGKCVVTPATLTVVGTSPVSFQVSMITHSSLPPGAFRGPWPHLPQGSISFEAFLLLLLLAAGGIVTGRRSRHAHAWIGAAILLACVATLLTACGGGGSGSTMTSGTPMSGTPTGTYNFTITGTTQAGVSRSVYLTLMVQ